MQEKFDPKSIIAGASKIVNAEAAKGVKPSASVPHEGAPVEKKNSAIGPDVNTSGTIPKRKRARGSRPKKQPTTDAVSTPVEKKKNSQAESIVTADGERSEDDYVSGKVFAEQYLEYHEDREDKDGKDVNVPVISTENKTHLEDVQASHETRVQVLHEEEGSIVGNPVAETLEGIKGLPEKPEEVVKAPETIDEKISGLKKEVEKMRAGYVKEDHETMFLFNKLKNVLGRNIGEDGKKREWQGLYEQTLSHLKAAEIEKLKSSGKTGEELKKEIDGLLRYFKLDEAVNIIEARTKYRAENQGWKEKTADTFGSLGRWYNRLSWKQKALLIGAATGAAILTGGIAGGTVASAILCGKRVLSGSATFVVTETLLEKLGDTRRTSKAEKDITEQTETLEKESLGATRESSFDALNAILEKDIASLDEKLQSEKRAKFYRKAGAMGAGIAIGSGWLSHIAMEKLGLGGVIDSVKEHVGNITSGIETTHPNVPVADPVIPSVIESGAPQTDAISNFLNQDIVVQKGDSVWKIAGRLADQLNLENSERTHFIDALKDQYGDVQLKTGETINFSDHGIDKGFVENALGQAKTLTAEQMASIHAHDVKIAEFASTHPDVTLTNESVDNILHGNTIKVESVSSYDPETQASLDNLVETVSVDKPDPLVALRETRHMLVQENIAFTDPKMYLMEHPEEIGRFNSTLGRLRMNIFMMNIGDAGTPMEYDYTTNGRVLGATKISDVLKDLNGFENDGLGYGYDRTVNPLHYDQMKDLEKFTEATKKAFGAKFSQVEAGEDIDHYTRRMATAALRTGKEIKGFFKQ